MRAATAFRALTLLAASLGLIAVAASPARALERFAVVVGNNQGGPGKVRLWFAEEDAKRFIVSESGVVVIPKGARIEEGG